MPIVCLVAAGLCGGALTSSRAAVLTLLPQVLAEHGLVAVRGAPAALLPLVPAFGLIPSALFLGERPGPLQVAGKGMVPIGGAVAMPRPAAPAGPDPRGGTAR